MKRILLNLYASKLRCAQGVLGPLSLAIRSTSNKIEGRNTPPVAEIIPAVYHLH